MSQAIPKKKSPKKDQVITLQAELIALESPPEVINLIPAQTNIIVKAINASPTEIVRILENKFSSWGIPAASGPTVSIILC